MTEGADGESRAAVAAVRALAAAGYRPAVTVSGGLSMAAASRFCERRIDVPYAAKDPAGYASAVRAELARPGYLGALAASDAALVALEVPVQGLLDKVACAEAARAAGIGVPPSRVFSSNAALRAAAGELAFPVVVKPDIKRFMARRVTGPEGLDRVPEHDGSLIVQPYLSGDLRGVLGLAWHGRLLGAVHLRYLRVWPLPCGTVAAGSSTAPDSALEGRLEHLLAGYDGIFHADFAGDLLLDLNPRVHATLPLAAASGVDLVAMYCDLLQGRDTEPARGRPGVLFRWIEGDLRSAVFRLRRRQVGLASALADLRPRRGTVHGYEFLSDPGPMLTRLRYLPRQYRRRAERIAAERRPARPHAGGNGLAPR